MMKNLYLILILFCCRIGYAQTPAGIETPTYSPGGLLENVSDNLGNAYKLSDIIIEPTRIVDGVARNTTPFTCTGNSIFKLWFEDGCGMTGDGVEAARRAVLCQVFQDISNFITTPTSPLQPTSATKVNIWIRNINNMGSVPAGVLGGATAYYYFPVNPLPNLGAIIDNQIWKTIHTGRDSYSDVSSRLWSTGVGYSATGFFYHGRVAINFNDVTVNNPVWNTDLSVNCPGNLHDLYTIMLHEITHALGFASLINDNGESIFGYNSKYYTRYDKFLTKKNNLNTYSLLISPNSISMYDYSFNSANLSTDILGVGSGCESSTTCGNEIRYVNNLTNTNIPVFTPSCYKAGSSLSHFEETLYPTCTTGWPNGGGYFAMCNNIDQGKTIRYLKSEERQTLCDIGYIVNSTFGITSTMNGFKDYLLPICYGNTVGGVNDGIDMTVSNAGQFLFKGAKNNQILVSGILNNDLTTTMSNLRFEGLQDVFDNTATLSTTFGDASTSIYFSSAIIGTHLLKYVPYDYASGHRGNITYVYVHVYNTNNCGTQTVCELVSNGNCENYFNLPTTGSGVYFGNVCSWSPANWQTPDYFNFDSTNNSFKIPCNGVGYENDLISGNKGYIGFYDVEPMVTTLTTTLNPYTTYQLSFDVSLAELSIKSTKLQAYFSQNFIFGKASGIPISNNSMLLTNNNFSSTKNGWEKVVFNFSTNNVSGEQFLYIGRLSESLYQDENLTPSFAGCSPTWTYDYPYYYIDNISLKPTFGGTLNFPQQICSNQILPNLNTFLTGLPTNGIFSAVAGITFLDNQYSFNANGLSLGNKLITYIYTNNLGCSVSIYGYITVTDCIVTSCPASLTFGTIEAATAATTYQVSNNILVNANYKIVSGGDITMRAGQAIQLDPDTEIQTGAKYLGIIEPCVIPSGREMAQEEVKDNATLIDKIGLTIAPNPTKSSATIATTNVTFNSILVSSIDGKLIFSQNIKNQNTYQLDLSNYQKGIYLISIETTDGKILREKIIKD